MIVGALRVVASRCESRLPFPCRGLASSSGPPTGPGSDRSARLSVEPASALVDRRVVVQASGLSPYRPVTIRSFIEHPVSKVRFEGHAHYLTDARGVVSLPHQLSLGGTYCGHEPMGPFWGLKPSPGQKTGSRLLTRDPSHPLTFHLSVHQGHLDTEALQTDEPEAKAKATRWYLDDNVETFKVHNGRLRGTLFKPKGPGPFPGVLDVYGKIGGLVEMRAAMLAAHGFACYALPFFNYQDLPTDVADIELEYFKEAVEWLDGQEFVVKGGVGIVGVSMGAQLALATACHFPEKVGVVVSINGFAAQAIFSMIVNGKKTPFIPFDGEKKGPSKRIEGAISMVHCYQDVYDAFRDDAETVYKLENNPGCHYLFIAGEEDESFDSRHIALEAVRRLAEHNHHRYQLLSYPEAGHLLEVPYCPSPESYYVPGFGLLGHGGTLAGNAKAMEDSWPKIIRTLRFYCGRQDSKL